MTGAEASFNLRLGLEEEGEAPRDRLSEGHGDLPERDCEGITYAF